MTPEKAAFLQALAEKTSKRQHGKFTEGDESHKEDFMAIDHLEEAFDEAIDLLSYIYGAMQAKRNEFEAGRVYGFEQAVKLETEGRLTKAERLGLAEKDDG